MAKTPFKVVRGMEENISTLSITDGQVLFAYDSGKLFIDKGSERFPIGNVGSAIYYGAAGKLEMDLATGEYNFPKESLEFTNDKPKEKDIIINNDGAFYRVIRVEDDNLVCNLLSVSGGGGGGAVITRPTFKILPPDLPLTILNGQDYTLRFQANSAKLGDTDEPLDENLTIQYELSQTISGFKDVYRTGQMVVKSGEAYELELGPYLRHNAYSAIGITVSGDNHELQYSNPEIRKVTTSDLYLQQAQSFSNLTVYNINQTTVNCTAIGDMLKVVAIKVDGKEVLTFVSNTTSNLPISATIPANELSHGHHKIRVELYQNTGTVSSPVRGYMATPLEYEVAVNDPSMENPPPIIWLDNYQEVYSEYDPIRIRYMVYDPTNKGGATKVRLLKDGVEISGSPRDITDYSNFLEWEISDATVGMINYYTISMTGGITFEGPEVSRNIAFEVIKDTERDFTFAKRDFLKVHMSATGRDNSEPLSSRQRILNLATSTEETKDYLSDVTFSNFNWVNNGWKKDEESNLSCLRISNGARLEIGLGGSMGFGYNDAGHSSHTVEVKFKIRNIQTYNDLITNITRYKDDATFYEEFKNQTVYDNYDAFLQNLSNQGRLDYDELEFNFVQKNTETKNTVFGLVGTNDEPSMRVGVQDAYFSSGSNTISTQFVENEIINLSFVFQKTNSVKLLLIYINGVLTGVNYPGLDTFNIVNPKLIFNSELCDIDLYSLKIYNEFLTVQEIVNNYCVENRDFTNFDLNTLLTTYNTVLEEYQLSYDKVIDYNSDSQNPPLMPYIIFDTTATGTEDKDTGYLALDKEDDKRIKVTFVNAPLERAYEEGRLRQLAIQDGLISEIETNSEVIEEGIRTYYKHHCPSWTSEISGLGSNKSEFVEMSVQGTSSQFYPRKNFKIKTKEKKATVNNKDVLNIFMNRGPYASLYQEDVKKLNESETGANYKGKELTRMKDGWYMNNYTNATDRWTLKVDYMESSGSYNAGFTSMIGSTGYTKHPLQDYIKAGVLTVGDDSSESAILNELKPDVKNLSAEGVRWNDYRTCVEGFPIMAFHKYKRGIEEGIQFVGYYRMLYDKGSDEVFGFKTSKSIQHKLVKAAKRVEEEFIDPDNSDNNKYVGELEKDENGFPILKTQRLRDVAECWEFATNSRGYCSFRDPKNRVELSFKLGEQFTNEGGAQVMNHYEYRYSAKEDSLDLLFEPGEISKIQEAKEQFGLDGLIESPRQLNLGDPTDKQNYFSQFESITEKAYENWEKANKWVWSTALEKVKSQFQYIEASGVGVAIDPQAAYFKRDESGEYIPVTESFTYETKPDAVFIQVQIEVDDKTTVTDYEFVKIADSQDLVYVKNKFYTKLNNDTYILCRDEVFDSALTYYIRDDLNQSAEELDRAFNRLIAPVNVDEIDLESETVYYTYDKEVTYDQQDSTDSAIHRMAVNRAVKGEMVLDGSIQYYIGKNIVYDGVTYTHDTREYRSAKFVNELAKHFDLEYLAVYFIMTEVFECYDSRGKNCMMASWGPLEEGGDYIWYPIFYDLDTQLGINNTGIPSFKYNVDATEQKNYSTSDSVLWNNFYNFFKNSSILQAYRRLRGIDKNILSAPPLETVNKIEKWYTFDPVTTKNIANEGLRPLIATNLDEYYKYITITNPRPGGGYQGLDSNRDVTMLQDSGSFFYALQGDRSQSRRQFLTNRLEYIDSWLTVGNYARGGSNHIRGRISANANPAGNQNKISDVWIANSIEDYWQNRREFSEKIHPYDSEYWLTLSPIRSAYVTAGDDSSNYASAKYDGTNPVKFVLQDIKNGVVTSMNYPEQLVYVYGLNQMKDLGNMSRLYWTEFSLSGNADRLSNLQLGEDALTWDETEGRYLPWFNKAVNQINLPASGLPLLKTANFSNMGMQVQSFLDLTKSEKLEDLRAIGASRLSEIKIANGVALKRLYYPACATSLTLNSANFLTKWITDPESIVYKVKNNAVEQEGEEGLFIEGFVEENGSIVMKDNCGLTTLSISNGSLGTDSAKMLKAFYENRKNTGGKVTMNNVVWSPYTLVDTGSVYDATNKYYVDNGHYGLVEYTESDYNADEYERLVLNKKMFVANFEGDAVPSDYYVVDDFVELLNNLAAPSCKIKDTTKMSGNVEAHPSVTGLMYVHNTTPIEESDIFEIYQQAYPGLRMFFNNVNQVYSVEFLQKNIDRDYFEYVDPINKDRQTVVKITNVAIPIPYPGDLGFAPKRNNYDFIGWSKVSEIDWSDTSSFKIVTEAADWSGVTEGVTPIVNSKEAWENSQFSILSEDIKDYKFYAIFKKMAYLVTFYNGDGSVLETHTYEFGTRGIESPSKIASKASPSSWPVDRIYGLKGYSESQTATEPIKLNMQMVQKDISLYPIFEEMDVRDNPLSSDFFDITELTYLTGITLPAGKRWCTLAPKDSKEFTGKITIPSKVTYNGQEYTVGAIKGFNKGTKRNVKMDALFFERDTEIVAFLEQALKPQSQSTIGFYLEIPKTVQIFGEACLLGLRLTNPSLTIDCTNIKRVGANAFNAMGTAGTRYSDLILLDNSDFGIGTTTLFGSNQSGLIGGFSNLNVSSLQFGAADNPTTFKFSTNLIKSNNYNNYFVSRSGEDPLCQIYTQTPSEIPVSNVQSALVKFGFAEGNGFSNITIAQGGSK